FLQNCSECKEKKPAHSLCTYCNKWLCCSCTEEHQHGKETSTVTDSSDCFPKHNKQLSPGSRCESSAIPLLCPHHNEEPLNLFCENCDVLICPSCQLSEHKEHRFRHLEEALQNQKSLLENLRAQMEEKKINMQTSAKQIEDRLYEVKHMRRKVENQIKMAKMIMINELNKRVNFLIEQLERITDDCRHNLEQQFQAFTILCKQLEHMQNFINWAAGSKHSIPFLFSKELVVFQMQSLLETHCNADLGPPCKIKFSWEPAFWTKHLSNLGHLTNEPGSSTHSTVPGYSTLHSSQPNFYQGPNAPPQQTCVNQVNKSQSPFQCPHPVCCNQYLNVPEAHKGPLAQRSMHHQQNFKQLSVPQQRYIMPYNLQQEGKQQLYVPHPLKPIHPWVIHNSQSRHDPESVWLGKHLQTQQTQQQHTSFIVPPHNVQDMHTGRPQQVHLHSFQQVQPCQLQPSQISSMPAQLGYCHQLQGQHLQQQQQSSRQEESRPHNEDMQQTLAIMQQQYKLEQMQKGLELVLHTQPPNLPLTQTKQPQQVQQTIVGQINYIVRQPAEKQQQVQDEVQQGSLQPAATTSHSQKASSEHQHENSKVTSVNVVNHVTCDPCSSTINAHKIIIFHSFFLYVNQYQMTEDLEWEEVPYRIQVQSDSGILQKEQPVCPGDGNVIPLVTKQLTEHQQNESPCTQTLRHLSSTFSKQAHTVFQSQWNIVKSSSPSKSDLPSYRLSRSTDLPKQSVAISANLLLHSMAYSANLGGTADHVSEHLHTGNAYNLATDHRELRSSEFKVENKDLTTSDESLGNDFTSAYNNQHVLLEENNLHEPINLSTKKHQPSASPSLSCNSTSYLQPSANPQYLLTFCQSVLKLPAKNHLSFSSHMKELKVPYVRLERLKICAPVSGEFPAFRMQKKEGEMESNNFLKTDHDIKNLSVTMEISDLKKESNEDPSSSLVCTNLLREVSVSDEKVTETAEGEKNPIENEDFCAVCLNGGELLCCDSCPKVFHLSCHVPALLSFPVGEWICTLCCNPVKPKIEYDCDNVCNSQESNEKTDPYVLSSSDQKKCEKLALYLYCNNLSLPFHEPVSPLARHYYQIIKNPMDLSVIRGKLLKLSPLHYYSPEQFVSDVRLMFRNCAKFNYADSEVAHAGRSLRIYFEEKLKEVFPDRSFSEPEPDDSDADEVDYEKYHVSSKEFQWPSHEHGYTKPKKRRRHATNNKQKRWSRNREHIVSLI
uniref:Tripartite motif containing 66 n=1 Tax=Latimeria chalumnae TaxID=7897 RepID=H3BA14_LATCH